MTRREIAKELIRRNNPELAREVLAALPEEDYGEGASFSAISLALDRVKAKWTAKGWVCKSIDLGGLNLIRLPKFKSVDGTLDVSHNKLETLAGCPEKVDVFYCNNNKLTTLVGCPKKVNKEFFCGNNKKKFSEEDVKKVCKVGGKIWT